MLHNPHEFQPSGEIDYSNLAQDSALGRGGYGIPLLGGNMLVRLDMPVLEIHGIETDLPKQPMRSLQSMACRLGELTSYSTLLREVKGEDLGLDYSKMTPDEQAYVRKAVHGILRNTKNRLNPVLEENLRPDVAERFDSIVKRNNESGFTMLDPWS